MENHSLATSDVPHRLLTIMSRLTDDQQLSESGRKNLQHIFTTWFPRAVYFDLTDDTSTVQVVVRKGIVSTKNVFNTSFLRADGSLIKRIDYDEERMIGKVCKNYDHNKSKYDGNKDGWDHRLAYYTPEPAPA